MICVHKYLQNKRVHLYGFLIFNFHQDEARSHIHTLYAITTLNFILIFWCIFTLYMFYDTLYAFIANACVHEGNAKVCFWKNAIALLIFLISALKVPRGLYSVDTRVEEITYFSHTWAEYLVLLVCFYVNCKWWYVGGKAYFYMTLIFRGNAYAFIS